MKSATLALVAALMLTLHASAKSWAKEVELCGASACTRVTGESAGRIAQLVKTLEGWGEPLWQDEPRPAPFYRMVVDRKTRWRWSFLYVPTARALRIDDPNDGAPSFWRTAKPVLRSELARRARGILPMPAPHRWPR